MPCAPVRQCAGQSSPAPVGWGGSRSAQSHTVLVSWREPPLRLAGASARRPRSAWPDRQRVRGRSPATTARGGGRRPVCDCAQSVLCAPRRGESGVAGVLSPTPADTGTAAIGPGHRRRRSEAWRAPVRTAIGRRSTGMRARSCPGRDCGPGRRRSSPTGRPFETRESERPHP
jgi:hypothetical protein